MRGLRRQIRGEYGKLFDIVCGVTPNEAKISEIENRISILTKQNFKILFLLILRPCILHHSVFWNRRYVTIVNNLLNCDVLLYQIGEWRICMRKIA